MVICITTYNTNGKEGELLYAGTDVNEAKNVARKFFESLPAKDMNLKTMTQCNTEVCVYKFNTLAHRGVVRYARLRKQSGDIE